MTKHEMIGWGFDVTEKQFVRALNKAVKMIKSGTKPGLDNLELYIDNNDWWKLHPFIDILNTTEIEYRRGKPQKINALSGIIKDYRKGRAERIKSLIQKGKELNEIAGWHHDAFFWQDDHNYPQYGRNKEMQSIKEINYVRDIPCNPCTHTPASNTSRRDCPTYAEVKNLYNSIREKWKQTEKHEIPDLEMLARDSADRYAHTRAETLGMLGLYKIKKYSSANYT